MAEYASFKAPQGVGPEPADRSAGTTLAPNPPVQTYDVMFRPGESYGEPHPNGPWFYFELKAADDGANLSSYLSRPQFNWLAERLALAQLSEEPDYDGAPYCSDCGARKRRHCKCPPHPRND